MHIHITRKGEQHGPYSEANAREMLAAGQLLPTDLAWYDGADGWKPLSEVLGVAAQPPAPPSEPNDPDKISVTRKGEPIGPYSREKAKEHFASGQLLPTDWGWHDGMNDWKPINEVLGMAASTKANAATEVPTKANAATEVPIWKKAFYIFSGLCWLIVLLLVGYGIAQAYLDDRKHGGASYFSPVTESDTEWRKKVKLYLPGEWLDPDKAGNEYTIHYWKITFPEWKESGGQLLLYNGDWKTQGGAKIWVWNPEPIRKEKIIGWELRQYDINNYIHVTVEDELGEEFVRIFTLTFTGPWGQEGVLRKAGRVSRGEHRVEPFEKQRLYEPINRNVHGMKP